MFQTEGEYSATAMDIIRKLISNKVAPDKKMPPQKKRRDKTGFFEENNRAVSSVRHGVRFSTRNVQQVKTTLLCA